MVIVLHRVRLAADVVERDGGQGEKGYIHPARIVFFRFIYISMYMYKINLHHIEKNRYTYCIQRQNNMDEEKLH